MGKTIPERLAALRAEMKKRNIDIYLIPTADYHESEYVGDFFKEREFITGFTGSAGLAAVTLSEAYLWTDGRYFIQAGRQLQGTGVTLFRSGEEGVPTLLGFLKANLPKQGKVGFDGRAVNCALAEKISILAKEKNARLCVMEDLVGMIWDARPPFPISKVWILGPEYCGEDTDSKLTRIREKMSEYGADCHLVSSLYDIAWILNIRGNDIPHVPVVLSFLLIQKHRCQLFINREALGPELFSYFDAHSVEVLPYDGIYNAVSSIRENETVWLDKNTVNFRIRHAIKGRVTILNYPNAAEGMKAVKNETELENTRIAHLRDGAAFTKFIFWLKKNIGSMHITEYSAGQYLDHLREQQFHFLDLSFDSICAYGANAAMMHYQADEKGAAVLKPEGFFLVDSGGHYLEGTTDITRTIVLGPLTEQQRLHFTAVCRANMNLANAKFLYGCTGLNLDILSRGPLWQMGIDYKCGTGHGVGHILNVHEGPNGFRWRNVPGRGDGGKLEAGMITTDEPGVYLEGEYGIRTENELLCQSAEKNEYGQFMSFENITYAPIDLEGIIPEEMSSQERGYLNDYHKNVYQKLAPYLTEEEQHWLSQATRAI